MWARGCPPRGTSSDLPRRPRQGFDSVSPVHISKTASAKLHMSHFQPVPLLACLQSQMGISPIPRLGACMYIPAPGAVRQLCCARADEKLGSLNDIGKGTANGGSRRFLTNVLSVPQPEADGSDLPEADPEQPFSADVGGDLAWRTYKSDRLGVVPGLWIVTQLISLSAFHLLRPPDILHLKHD